MNEYHFLRGSGGINPALGISVTEPLEIGDKESPRYVSRLSRADAMRIFEAAPDEEARLLMMLMWETGARLHELLDLRPRDVDIERSALLFREKNSSIRNVVPISDELFGRLSVFLAHIGACDRKRIFEIEADDLVQIIHELGRKILGRAINPYSFTQGRAFELVARGINPFLVARALARSNLMMLVTYFGRRCFASRPIPV